ncbi:MAG: tetratricopeptide repeat protein [Promethearchaeota archaeon]|nr:MAG: tetratricopeptide repeat protein [Candidatus Lokiarchaeota archaeon]
MNENIERASDKIPRLIAEIEHLLDVGHFPQAQEILTSLESLPISSIRDQMLINYVKIKLGRFLEDFGATLAIGLPAYRYALEKQHIDLGIKIGIELADVHSRAGDDTLALDLLEEVERLVHNHFYVEDHQYHLFFAHMDFIKSGIYWHLGQLDTALARISSCCELWKQWGSTFEIANALSLAGMINCEKGHYLKGMELLKEALGLQNELGNQYYISKLYNNIGWMFRLQGDFSSALRYLNRSVRIVEKIAPEVSLRISLANIGAIYRQMGKFEDADRYLLRALTLGRKVGNAVEIAIFLYYLINLRLEQNQLQEAKILIDELQFLGEKTGNEKIQQRFQLSTALYLKKNLRVKNVYLAQKIFRDIANEAIIKHELTVEALINLCDLLIFELQISNEEESLLELTQTMNRLLVIAKEMHSYYLWAEIHFFKAKLSLISFDIQLAREYLVKAQTLAEEQGLSQLAIKISNAHDTILEQEQTWENFKENPPDFDERVQMANMDDNLSRIKRQGIVESEEVTPVNPVMITILNETGPTIYTYQFTHDLEVNDQLLGGILAAFDSFSSEIFAGVLERAKFGDFSILVKKMSPFIISYIYRGRSYGAQRQFHELINILETNSQIWQFLTDAISHGNLLSSNRIPELNRQIQIIFDPKSD